MITPNCWIIYNYKQKSVYLTYYKNTCLAFTNNERRASKEAVLVPSVHSSTTTPHFIQVILPLSTWPLK